jgi:hypothetical protein
LLVTQRNRWWKSILKTLEAATYDTKTELRRKTMILTPTLIKQKEYEDEHFYQNVTLEKVGPLFRFYDWAKDSDSTEVFLDNEKEAIDYFDRYIRELEE